MITESQ